MKEQLPPQGSNTNDQRGAITKLRHTVFGKPRSLSDHSLFEKLSLIPILAWIGLGADGLSSSSYGPEEAFRTLGEHTFLAVVLAALVVLTIIVIASAYSHIVEQFPHGGGGYVVATKLLGRHAGVTSGCALVVDYVLTITVSIAASGDALFSFLPVGMQPLKLPAESLMILGLILLNSRGVRESVLALAPIFLLFIVTHAIAIIGGTAFHMTEARETLSSLGQSATQTVSTLGIWGTFLLIVHAYSLGGGTYTGIEAVSNGLPIMREPQVRTAKRTMLYMAVSLIFTAAGLLVCYLLWKVAPEHGKTLNAVFLEKFSANIPYGYVFVVATLLSEGLLLVVGAQAGFIDGPRVLANMALDSWVPHRFAALSERFTAQNGVALMGFASLAALFYTKGKVSSLVVMYSINVFLTFSLSMAGMLRYWLRKRDLAREAGQRILQFGVGLALCATILLMTTIEKFGEGGWLTVSVTAAVIALCLIIRKHYRTIAHKMNKINMDVERLLMEVQPIVSVNPARDGRIAVLLVSNFSNFGLNTLANMLKAFPEIFRGIIFASVAELDTGGFKGRDSIDELKARTLQSLEKYVVLARKIGLEASCRMSIGTDRVAEAERLCLELAHEHPKITFFAGKVIFAKDHWYHRLLHNDTAHSIQRRLEWAGLTTVILPTKIV